MGERSNLSVPEQREVVLAMLRRDGPVVVLARRYGVSERGGNSLRLGGLPGSRTVTWHPTDGSQLHRAVCGHKTAACAEPLCAHPRAPYRNSPCQVPVALG